MKIFRLFVPVIVFVVLVFCFFQAAVIKNNVESEKSVFATKDRTEESGDAPPSDKSSASDSVQERYRESRRLTVRKAKIETAVVTGYYKPLPGQKRYAFGSYEADLRVNGDGWTATDEETYVGAAATSNLLVAPFGSYWIIEDWGLVRVNDRKGRLTHNLELDIFCGEGDEGLEVALSLGRKRCRSYCVSR